MQAFAIFFYKYSTRACVCEKLFVSLQPNYVYSP